MKKNIQHSIFIFALTLMCIGMYAQKAGKTYYLQSAIAGKYIDVQGKKTANGTPIHLWSYNGGNSQKFILEDAGGGYFYIKSGLGKYIHSQNGSKMALAHLWGGKGNDNSKWKFKTAPNGYYYIQSKNGTYLDVKRAKSANGTPIWLWTFNPGGDTQRWKFKAVTSASTGAFIANQPLFTKTAISLSLAKVAQAQQGTRKQKAGGPNFNEEPFAPFSNIDADLSDRFGPTSTSKFSRLNGNIIPDKVPGSGVFYYIPDSYHLEWDRDLNKHGLRINYSRNTEGRENKSARVSATLTSGITIAEINFMEGIIREMIKNQGVTKPYVELKPLPVKSPRIEFQGGGSDLSEEQITIVAFSNFEEKIQVSFTTSDDNIDALKNGELKNKLSFIMHFQSSIDEEQVYDIPADISIMDEDSYGIFEIKDFPSLMNIKNPTPYPLKAKYLHILTTTKTSEGVIPYVYSFELDNKIIQPNDILKFIKPTNFSGHKVRRKPLRAFIEYKLQECDPCTQDIINELTGGVTAATKQEIKFSTINLLKITGAVYADVYVKSKQLDPSKQKIITLYDPLRIDEDNTDFKSSTIYLINGEQPDFEYRVELFTEDDQYESNWIKGNKQRITLSKSRLRKHFNQWPEVEITESSEENEEDKDEN